VVMTKFNILSVSQKTCQRVVDLVISKTTYGRNGQTSTTFSFSKDGCNWRLLIFHYSWSLVICMWKNLVWLLWLKVLFV